MLIVAGVAGIGVVVDRAPWAIEVLRWLGVAFLPSYGVRSLLRARHPQALAAAAAAASRAGAARLAAVALTWLNPHVYLDTVLLLGSIANHHGTAAAGGSRSGASLASVAVVLRARLRRALAAPLLAQPRSWQVLDVLIGRDHAGDRGQPGAGLRPGRGAVWPAPRVEAMTDGAVDSTGSTDGSDGQRLAGYVEVWWQAVDDFTQLLEELSADDWERPTDLPGWDVHDVAAHTAHLEAILAGSPEETVDVGKPAHVTGLMGLYTEQGVVARKDRTPDELITEIREAATGPSHRAAGRPADRRPATPPRCLRWRRLGLGAPCCATVRSTCGCTSRTCAARSAAPAGSTARRPRTSWTTCRRASATCWRRRSARRPAPPCCSLVARHAPVAYAVDEAGRGVRLPEAPESPTATIACDREPSSCSPADGGARRTSAVSLRGDAALGRQVVDALAVTP